MIDGKPLTEDEIGLIRTYRNRFSSRYTPEYIEYVSDRYSPYDWYNVGQIDVDTICIMLRVGDVMNIEFRFYTSYQSSGRGGTIRCEKTPIPYYFVEYKRSDGKHDLSDFWFEVRKIRGK